MSGRIAISPDVCHGNPVVKGTRIPVSQLIGALAGGDTVDEVLEDYPGVCREDVYAALAFAGELAQFETAPYDVCMA